MILYYSTVYRFSTGKCNFKQFLLKVLLLNESLHFNYFYPITESFYFFKIKINAHYLYKLRSICPEKLQSLQNIQFSSSASLVYFYSISSRQIACLIEIYLHCTLQFTAMFLSINLNSNNNKHFDNIFITKMKTCLHFNDGNINSQKSNDLILQLSTISKYHT